MALTVFGEEDEEGGGGEEAVVIVADLQIRSSLPATGALH
jgi:hypothetical protein